MALDNVRQRRKTMLPALETLRDMALHGRKVMLPLLERPIPLVADEWAKRGTKVIGLSVDGVEEHVKWKSDIEGYAGAKAGFPIIADKDLAVSKAFDMLPAEAYLPDGRTPADSATVRTVFIIGPDKKVRLTMTYPMSVGRNFAEIVRALDAVQKTDGASIAIRSPAPAVPAPTIRMSQRAMGAAAESFAQSATRLAIFINEGIAPATERLAALDGTLSRLEGTVNAIRDFTGVRTEMENLTRSLAKAAAEGKPVLVDFYTDW